MRPLIEHGYVYAAMAPLYKITKGKETFYLADDSELNEYKIKHAGEKFEVGHFKGLGEMSPDELKETTIGIENRRLKQIVFNDEKQIALTLNKLMGSTVAPRKDFISENSYKANISI